MAGMHRQPVAILDRVDDCIDVGDGQAAIHSINVPFCERADDDAARV
jgi:hypothetical protein